MAQEISLSIEETNKLRISLGLKPIKADTSPEDEPSKPNSNNNGGKAGTAIESANSYDRSAFIDEKVTKLRRSLQRAKSNASSDTVLGSKNDDGIDKDWLNKVGTKKTARNTISKKYYDEEEENEESNSNNDLGLKVSRTIVDLPSNGGVILTLKEADIGAEDAEDVLVDEGVTQDAEQAKKLRLKRINEERKRKKIKAGGSYEEEDEETEYLRLVNGKIIGTDDKVSGENQDDGNGNRIKVTLESSQSEGDDKPASDFAPTKMKKRKKLKSQQLSRKRPRPVSQAKKVVLIDEDMDDPVDERQDFLTIQRRPNNDKSEKHAQQIALELDRERKEKEQRAASVSRVNKSQNLIIDESSAFLDALKSDIVAQSSGGSGTREFEKIDLKAASTGNLVTKPAAESISEKEEELSDQKKPQFHDGLASTLSFLRDRQILPARGQNVDAATRKKEADLLALKQKVEGRKVKERFQKELLQGNLQYSKDELDRIQEFQDKEVTKRNNEIQSERLANYNPQVKLTYKDERGNELTTKEAYKKLSQAFHGTRSNRKKQTKALQKVEQRNKQGYLGP